MLASPKSAMIVFSSTSHPSQPSPRVNKVATIYFAQGIGNGITAGAQTLNLKRRPAFCCLLRLATHIIDSTLSRTHTHTRMPYPKPMDLLQCFFSTVERGCPQSLISAYVTPLHAHVMNNDIRWPWAPLFLHSISHGTPRPSIQTSSTSQSRRHYVAQFRSIIWHKSFIEMCSHIR